MYHIISYKHTTVDKSRYIFPRIITFHKVTFKIVIVKSNL